MRSDVARQDFSIPAADVRRAESAACRDCAEVGGIVADAERKLLSLDCPVCARAVAPAGSEAKRFAVYHCPSVGRKHFTAFVLRPGASLEVSRALAAEADDLLGRLTRLVEGEES